MNTRKILNYIICFLIAALLFPIFLFTAVEMVTYDQSFYKKQYEQLGTAELIGISDEELLHVTRELTDYIRDRSDSLEPIKAEIKGTLRQVFNEREILHMVDVKALFQFGSRVRNTSIIGILVLALILYFMRSEKRLQTFAKAYLTASGLLILLLLIAIPIIKSNFTYYWDQFHYLFFSNDLWLLNPKTDIMIQMVPEPFFYHAVLRVVIYFGLWILIVGIISLWILCSSTGKKKWH